MRPDDWFRADIGAESWICQICNIVLVNATAVMCYKNCCKNVNKVTVHFDQIQKVEKVECAIYSREVQFLIIWRILSTDFNAKSLLKMMETLTYFDYAHMNWCGSGHIRTKIKLTHLHPLPKFNLCSPYPPIPSSESHLESNGEVLAYRVVWIKILWTGIF